MSFREACDFIVRVNYRGRDFFFLCAIEAHDKRQTDTRKSQKLRSAPTRQDTGRKQTAKSDEKVYFPQSGWKSYGDLLTCSFIFFYNPG